MSKNNDAWVKLFEKYDILKSIEKDGFFKISAEQIRQYREPRLMSKFDHKVNLPEVFAENKLAILPITRGDYIISHFEAYHVFEQSDSHIKKVSLPTHIQSLDADNITSEAMALNCAFASGIIADFTEDEELTATVSGRMSSGEFDFDINDKDGNHTTVNVANSQIEIDAAYEGIRFLSIFEAKNVISDDFLTRQLYYPFRACQKRVTKPVKPIFLVYSNGIYRLYEYEFENKYIYNSLKLIRQQNYSIEDTAINISDIQSVINSTEIVQEPAIPFPQADSFERIINLCELVSDHGLNKAKITEEYAFDARQTDYYLNASRYLGLIFENEEKTYSVTEKGKKILSLKYKERQLEYCRTILSHKAFNQSLKKYLQSGKMPTKNEIVDIMKKSSLYNVSSESTFKRRSQTIRSWIEWIVSLVNE